MSKCEVIQRVLGALLPAVMIADLLAGAFATDALADSYGAAWYDVEIGDSVYAVHLDMGTAESVGGPLDYALHGDDLEHIYVVGHETGQPVTSLDIRVRATLLAQNTGIVTTSTNWMSYLSSIEHGTAFGPQGLIDSEGREFRLLLPSCVNDWYALWLLDGRLGNNLKNADVRREYYKRVVEAMVFPQLTPETAPDLGHVFDADLGDLFDSAKREAEEAGYQKGTMVWAGHVWTIVGLRAEQALARAGRGTKFIQAFNQYVAALAVWSEVKESWDVWDEASTRAQLMHAYMQGMSAERLAALVAFSQSTTIDIDPAFPEAVAALVQELEQIDSDSWKYVLAEFFRSDTVTGHALDILTTASNLYFIAASLLGTPVAPGVAALIFTVEFTWLGYRAVQAIWEWYDTRDDQVSVAAIAQTVSDVMRTELRQRFVGDPPAVGELEQWLLFSHMRLAADHMFYGSLLERTSWLDEFLWSLWGVSSAEVDGYLEQKCSETWNAFLATMPPVYWAYEQVSWILSVVYASPVPLAQLDAPGVLPGSGGTTDTGFRFSVTYVDGDNSPPEYVRLIVDDAVFPMSSLDLTYDNGAVFESGAIRFEEVGEHTYSFAARAVNESEEVTLGPWTFSVVAPEASGVGVTAAPSSVEVGTGQTSTIRVVVTGGRGQPISGETVSFSSNGWPGAFTDCTTGEGTLTAVTDPGGEATLCFEPTSMGTVTISASAENGMTGSTQLEATGSADNVDVRFQLQNLNPTTYQVNLTVTYAETAGPIGQEPVLLATGWGTLSKPGQTSGSQVVLETNQDGHADAQLELPSAHEVVLTASVRGSNHSYSAYLGPGDFRVVTAFVDIGCGQGIDWSADGDTVSCGDGAENASVYSTDDWSMVRAWLAGGGGQGIVWGVSHSPDGSNLAVGWRYVGRYRISDGYLYWDPPRSISGSNIAVDWCPSGGSWIAGGGFNESKVWNTSGGEVRTFTHADNRAHVVEFSPNGQYLLTGHAEGDIRIYRTSDWSVYRSIQIEGAPHNSVRDASWAPDSSAYAVATDESGVLIFDVGSTSPRSTRYGGHGYNIIVHAVAWSPVTDPSNPAYGLIASSNSAVHVWRSSNAQRLLQINRSSNGGLAWSPDGSFLALASGGGIVALWDDEHPEIAITSHYHGQVVAAETVTVEGSITDEYGIKVATATVNGGTPQALSLAPDGSFSDAVSGLVVGANTIEVAATDGTGNKHSVSFSLTRLADESPPLLDAASVSPASGEFCSTFTVSARVVDPWSGVDPSSVSARLQHPDGTDVVAVTLYDDGTTGGDEAEGDDIFTGQWDSCAATDEGLFYVDVEAADNEGNAAYLDNARTCEVYDLPTVSLVSHSPSDPTDTDPVVVTAVILDSSGVANATLFHSGDGGSTYSPASMSYDVGVGEYQATIPPHNAGQITYRVEAVDTWAHGAASDTSTYTVIDASAPGFYGWQRDPSDLSGLSTGDLQVRVSVYDTGGSGLDGMVPRLKYKRGSADPAYSAYQDMVQLSEGTWAYTIPEPPGAWRGIEDEYVTYVVQFSDVAGNVATSNTMHELVDRWLRTYVPLTFTRYVPGSNRSPYAPGAPTPEDEAVDLPVDTLLSWQGGDPDGDQVTYDVYRGTDDPPSVKVCSGILTETCDPGSLSAGEEYFWKVVATDEHGESRAGDVWRFTTASPNNPPYEPTPLAPKPGATDQPLDVQLSWSGGDPDPGDTVTYDVYFGSSCPPALVPSDPASTTYDPGALDEGQHYCWKIVARDNHGEETPGPEWGFDTQSAICYTLTTWISPEGAGSVGASPAPDCGDGMYSSGTVVELTPTANPGYLFSHWTGDEGGSSNPTTIIMSGNMGVQANFTEDTPVCYTLTTPVSPTGSGTVDASPAPNCDGDKYLVDTMVELTPTPNEGYLFSEWTGDRPSTDDPLNVTMTGDMNVQAEFTEDPRVCYSFAVGVTPVGGGTVTVTPEPDCAGGKYSAGTLLELSADPSPGYAWGYWDGDLIGTANPSYTNIDGNWYIVAHFTQ